MKIDKSLTLIGVIIVILSMTMATQYATTRAVYSFTIVHPSDADIRFIGSDNSSGDNMRVLRVNNNGSGTQYVTIELGSWMPNSQKNYTAAFALVNEEQFKVNITYVNISGTNNSYVTIWLHGDRDVDAGSDGTAVKIIDNGVSSYDDNSVVWTLGAGDSNTNTMNASGGGDIGTPWDDTSHVRYSLSDWDATNETSDFVWVQISLNIESTASLQAATGTLYFHFKAATIS